MLILINFNKPGDGLCPNIPLNIAGILIDPAISDAIPQTDAPLPTNAALNYKSC